MKTKALFQTIVLLCFPWLVATAGIEVNSASKGYGDYQKKVASEINKKDRLFPIDMECTPQPVYRYRQDGKPGREVIISLKGAKLSGKAQVEVKVNGTKEITEIIPMVGGDTICHVLLPDNVGVKQESQVTLTLIQGDNKIKKTIKVPLMRHWNVYLYNHSHVDIGYTNTQKNVEILHKTNIIEGIKLAEASKNYPEGARYRWNPEVTWPLERLWQSNPEEHDNILKAISDGQLCVDASYLNLNTSACSDEELFHAFSFSRKMQKLTGKPMDVFQQMDIPGISWGLVPVMAQEGVRYIMSWPNNDRAGNAHKGIDQQPFWWVGPDGKSKVLFFQPGGYANSGSMDKGMTTGRPWFGQRDPDKVPPVIKTGSANVDFTKKLADMQKAKYPYDFLVLSWTLWDNCPLDADIPDAVKSWNEKYAYPHITIAGGHEIMEMIEKKYGDQLPVVKGDYTEYWTDGLGTAAGLTALNRNAKEKLTQAETLWTMLCPGKPAPREQFDEAWRFIALGSEHTWCSENTTEPFFLDAIWKVKQQYFHEASDRSQTLFEEALAPVTDKSNGGLGPAEGPANGGIAVFNTHSWKHGGLVTLSPSESRPGNRVIDEQGNEVPVQRLSTGELVFLSSDIPAFGSRHYRVVKGESSQFDGCKLSGTTLENQQLRVMIDPVTGNITQLVKLANGRNYADAKVNGGLNAFRWLPANVDAPKADSSIVITTVESGPLVVELNVKSKGVGCRSVSRSVRLVAGQPWAEITNIVDKLPLVAKDGIHFGFGFDIPQGKTRVDIPWGVVEMEKDQWPQGNRNWIAMQRWLDISNDKDGVTWCSLDAPLFEYGKMTANISLSWGGKGPWLTKLEPTSTIYSWVMNNHWHTNFPLTQDGPVTFRYRIFPHGAYDAAAANRFGLEQSQPLAHVAANINPKITPLVAIDNDRVCVTILKSGSDGKTAIIRLRSLSDTSEVVSLYYPAKKPKSTNMCIREEIPGEPVSGSVTLPPHGSVTLRLDF
jgi:alpha-mannosidase